MRRAGFLCLLLLSGCASDGPPVEIVVPTGYTGMVWIVVDPDAPEIPLVNGRYEVVIPAGGVLRVRSLKPFLRWHSQTARYQDGMPLPAERDNPEVIALRGSSTSVIHPRNGREYRTLSFFVGTAKQYHELSRDELFELPEAAK